MALNCTYSELLEDIDENLVLLVLLVVQLRDWLLDSRGCHSA